MYCKLLKKQFVKHKEELQSYHPDDTSMPTNRILNLARKKKKVSV